MNDAASEPGATGDGGAARIPLGKGRALVPVPRPAPRPEPLAGLGRSHALIAAGVAAVMGIGFAAGTAALAWRPQGAVLAQASLPAMPLPALSSVATPAEAAPDALARVQGELRSLRSGLDGLRAAADDDRQADALRGLKRAVDALKQEVEGVKVASAGAVGQLGARIERLDRDPDAKGGDARIAETKAAEAKAAEVKAADARVAQVAAQLNARLDRLERQMASSDATGSIPRDATAQLKAPLPPPRVAQATAPPAAPPSAKANPQAAALAGPPPASPSAPQAAPAPVVAALPPPRPASAGAEPARPDVQARADVAAPPRQPEAPRSATVEGWLLRDVYGGVALLEGRAGGLREVAPGEYVPGVGEIRSIERRGRGWVVVTSRGLIQGEDRW